MIAIKLTVLATLVSVVWVIMELNAKMIIDCVKTIRVLIEVWKKINLKVVHFAKVVLFKEIARL